MEEKSRVSDVEVRRPLETLERTSERPAERRERPRTFPRSLSLTRWRPNSLANLITPNRSQRSGDVLHSYPPTESLTNSDPSPGSPIQNNDDKALQVRYELPNLVKENSKRRWSTIVTVIIVEAKGLPDPPGDGSTHNLYCKLRLGSETSKSKTVQSSHHPEWNERFKLHLNKDHILQVTLWDKGKQKNFMGSCVLDLSNLDKERSHEIWQDLDDGFGAIHLNVTMCAVRNVADSPTSEQSLDEAREKFALLNLHNLDSVGQLHVKVVGARGLSGRPYAYSTLEVGNEKVQTHCTAKATPEPMWNKSYVFNVKDVSNTLDVKVCDSSLISTLTMDSLGKVSIPLLRIRNGEQRWYALKDRSKRGSAKGNCPRILLEMSLIFNPVKGALRLFQVPEVKYGKKKTYKFDLAMVYSNTIFVKNTFDFLVIADGAIREFLEWENRELSTIVLVGWLVVWYYLRPWMLPLLLLVPFIFFWFTCRHQFDTPISKNNSAVIEASQSSPEKSSDISLASKIQGLPEVTLTITQGIEYLESVHQRVLNLVTFKVPFYSYFMMTLLVIAAVVMLFVPFNYLMMILGIYKYTRKYQNPNRILNHDILEFLNRVPDNEILKDWEELSVPEPHHHRTTAGVLVRSDSCL